MAFVSSLYLLSLGVVLRAYVGAGVLIGRGRDHVTFTALDEVAVAIDRFWQIDL